MLERFKFIGFGFATTDSSFKLLSWNLSEMAHCFLIGSERKLLRWRQENTGNFMMFNKRRRWFHSSRVMFLLVNMFASWFLMSTSCWLTDLFSLQLQKTTSFLTQCYIWEVSVPNQSKHGKVRLNGFWKPVIFERIGSDRRWTNGIRVDNVSRIDNVGNSRRDSKDDFWITVWTWALPKKDHLHVNVQWHWLAKTRRQRKLYCESSQSYWVCSKIHARTLVISGAWIGEEMVRNSRMQTRRTLGRSCWGYDDQLCGKRTSKILCIQRSRNRRVEK